MATFTIYADFAQEVSKRLDRLAKKAAGFSIPFSYTVSDEHPETVRVRGVDQVNQTIETVSTYTTAVVDVNVECDGLIRANGWTIRVKVEHGKDGNIVTAFGDAPVDPRWYTAPANCDHDDCEVVSVELDDQFINGKPSPCIAVYVGDRIRK